MIPQALPSVKPTAALTRGARAATRGQAVMPVLPHCDIYIYNIPSPSGDRIGHGAPPACSMRYIIWYAVTYCYVIFLGDSKTKFIEVAGGGQTGPDTKTIVEENATQYSYESETCVRTYVRTKYIVRPTLKLSRGRDRGRETKGDYLFWVSNHFTILHRAAFQRSSGRAVSGFPWKRHKMRQSCMIQSTKQYKIQNTFIFWLGQMHDEQSREPLPRKAPRQRKYLGTLIELTPRGARRQKRSRS